MISSTNNEYIKQLTKLKDRKYRLETREFLVEGPHLVEEAIHMGRCKMVLTVNEFDDFSVPFTVVSKEVMKKLSDVDTPPGVIGLCTLENDAKITDKVLLLDHLQDPGNLGTIIRSAIAFGFDTIVAEGSVDLYNPKVVRSTQGGIFKINFLEQNLITFIKNNPSFEVIASIVDGKSTLEETKSSKKIALIIGNEASGIRKEVLDLSHTFVTIPMKNTESLNAGVAASILMYHFSQ
ncbi:MAG: TrmH family RNA methyltransferase [Candidatus Izemoplasmatales bacterium]